MPLTVNIIGLGRDVGSVVIFSMNKKANLQV